MYKIRLQRDFFKLAINEWIDKTLLLTSKLCPLGAVFPCPGAIYMYKSMKKKCMKSDFKEILLKLVANDRSDKRLLLTSKLCPLVLSVPVLRYIHLLNHEKMCIKSEVEEIHFKFATNGHSDEVFCWHQKFGANGLSVPAQGLSACIKSRKNVHKIRRQSYFWNMHPVIIVIRPFCLHQKKKKKNVPKGCLFLPWGFVFLHVWNKTNIK